MTMPTQDTQTLIAKIYLLPVNRITEVESFVDFLSAQVEQKSARSPELLDFPVDHLGTWQEKLNLRREDMYNNDGR